MNRSRIAITLNFLAILGGVLACNAYSQGVLETPSPTSTQSGIGVISGWNCTAKVIEVSIDGGPRLTAASHTSRGDTRGVCGRTDTGFSLLFNFNLLPTSCFGCRYHRIDAFADGVSFASTEFQAENFGAEFLTGKKAEYLLPNFPEIGSSTWIKWDENLQNFSIDLTAANQSSASGTYYGALITGPTNPACGPFPLGRVLPTKYGAFLVESSNGQLALTAQFADGSSCKLPKTAIEPFDLNNIDGYVRAVYDQAATASCADLPNGLDVKVNGQRFVAFSLDTCRTENALGAR